MYGFIRYDIVHKNIDNELHVNTTCILHDQCLMSHKNRPKKLDILGVVSLPHQKNGLKF